MSSTSWCQFDSFNCEFPLSGPSRLAAIDRDLNQKDPFMPMTSSSATLLQAPGSIVTNTASTPSDFSEQLTPPRKQARHSPAPDSDVILKRQRNTIAARKYRQKRLDRITELETALKAMTRERDDLKIQLARQEAETSALKELMRSRPS